MGPRLRKVIAVVVIVVHPVTVTLHYVKEVGETASFCEWILKHTIGD